MTCGPYGYRNGSKPKGPNLAPPSRCVYRLRRSLSKDNESDLWPVIINTTSLISVDFLPVSLINSDDRPLFVFSMRDFILKRVLSQRLLEKLRLQKWLIQFDLLF